MDRGALSPRPLGGRGCLDKAICVWRAQLREQLPALPGRHGRPRPLFPGQQNPDLLLGRPQGPCAAFYFRPAQAPVATASPGPPGPLRGPAHRLLLPARAVLGQWHLGQSGVWWVQASGALARPGSGQGVLPSCPHGASAHASHGAPHPPGPSSEPAVCCAHWPAPPLLQLRLTLV